MRELDTSEKREMRQWLFQLVEHGLPQLVTVPIPPSVRTADWFVKANIQDSLKLFAFRGDKLPVFSGKLMPAFKLFLADEAAGKLGDGSVVVGATSGNYGKDAAVIASAFGSQFCAVVNKGLPQGKLNHLLAAGALIQEAPEGIPATEYVYEYAKGMGYHVQDQYVREESILGHEWTMNHIARELERLGEGGCILGAVTGTCSTIMAADRFLKKRITNKKFQLLGVASMSKQQKVPGSRSPEDLAELERIGGFPYKEVLDFPLVSSVTRDEVFTLNAELVQKMLISVGPTGALLESGFFHLLRERVEAGTVDSLRNERGSITVVMVWIDSYLAYLEDPKYLSFFRR